MADNTSGDRVKVLCTSSLQDRTFLETEQVRKTPYWIRAGASGVANGATEALVGMRIGDRKTILTAPLDARAISLDLEVVDIRASSPAHHP